MFTHCSRCLEIKLKYARFAKRASEVTHYFVIRKLAQRKRIIRKTIPTKNSAKFASKLSVLKTMLGISSFMNLKEQL